MVNRKSRVRNFGRAERNDDISNQTLVVMVILVLVVSVLSATMYVYAFYGGGYSTPKSQETKSVTAEQQTASGVATMQIIKPPEGSK